MEYNKIDEVQNKLIAAIDEVRDMDNSDPINEMLNIILENSKDSDIKNDIAMIREIDKDKRFLKKLRFVLRRYI